MGTILFASDLDNTLLFSHRHRQPEDRCVERLNGAEQGPAQDQYQERQAHYGHHHTLEHRISPFLNFCKGLFLYAAEPAVSLLVGCNGPV